MMQAVQQHTQQDDFKTDANGKFWEQFYDDFNKHASDIDQLSLWIQPAILTLYSQILNKSKYQHALERAYTEVIQNNNLVIPLFENSFMRVNLIALESGCNLPLHDHPGSAGSMMVISGDVRAIVCEQTDSISNSNHSSTLLSVVEKKILSVAETNCFTSEQHNIHSFEAVTDRAVLITIHTPPFTALQQSYFFTASPLQKTGSQMLVQRIRTQVAKKFH